jgi:hypothetical protein
MSETASGDDQVVIKISDAQIEVVKDVTIMDLKNNNIVLKGPCAETVKAEYKKFDDAYPVKRSLKIILEIEVPEAEGKWVG